jgi:predicted TIM-barrel fold metal-dependent hydrolase
MKATRRLERAVKDFGAIAVHLMPATTGLPANHQSYYPVYAKAAELGVPVKINTGFPGPSTKMGELQRTENLDEICVAFPELTVCATHVGHPWHLATVAMLQKHANFRLITAGFAPKHVPEEIWRAANTSAGHKVMWSSDFPVLPMDRTANEGWDVPLKEEVRRKYLRDNALETFKFD